MAGKLYLIPTVLGEDGMAVIHSYVFNIIHQLDEFIVERAKTARRYIKATGIDRPIHELTIHELDKYDPTKNISQFLKNAEQGQSIGLISEAGCPGVADPGAEVVALAHLKGIQVIPMVGPSSILLALMASGMNGQSFTFHGYLSPKRPDRIKELKRLEQQSLRLHQTQLFIETPYRNMAMIEDVLSTLGSKTKFCIAADLTLSTEYVVTKTIEDWKKIELPDFHKRPAIFLIG